MKKGLCKSIGVSNFNTQILLDLLSYAKIKPAVNEIEFHPYLQQIKFVKFCQKFGVQVIGYSTFVRNRLDVLNEPVLVEIAKKHKRKTTEIILKWCYDLNIAVIPKTTNIERMKENFNFEDINLDEEDLKKISTLHNGKRLTERVIIFLRKYFILKSNNSFLLIVYFLQTISNSLLINEKRK